MTDLPKDALHLTSTWFFDWHYAQGTGGFAYVKFPVSRLPLLGGIGQANDKEPGWEAGRNFYLSVRSMATRSP